MKEDLLNVDASPQYTPGGIELRKGYLTFSFPILISHFHRVESIGFRH